MSIYSDEERRSIMEMSRANVERLKDMEVSEPIYTKQWTRRPEPEEPPRQPKLDTNITAHVEARCEYLESKLAEILPAIATFMENTAKEWNAIKARAETAEKRLVETEKKLADMQRTHALDLRSVELASQSDLLSLRQERLPGKRKEPA